MTDTRSYTEKGQSLVEMAISATLLLFLLLATIDFGYGFLYWITIRDAAQEGAMYGSTHPRSTAVDSSYLKRWVTSSAESSVIKTANLDVNKINVFVNNNVPINSLSPCDPALKAGNSITVKVTHLYHILTPLVSNVIGTDLTLTASVTNTILRDDDYTCP